MWNGVIYFAHEGASKSKRRARPSAIAVPLVTLLIVSRSIGAFCCSILGVWFLVSSENAVWWALSIHRTNRSLPNMYSRPYVCLQPIRSGRDDNDLCRRRNATLVSDWSARWLTFRPTEGCRHSIQWWRVARSRSEGVQFVSDVRFELQRVQRWRVVRLEQNVDDRWKYTRYRMYTLDLRPIHVRFYYRQQGNTQYYNMPIRLIVDNRIILIKVLCSRCLHFKFNLGRLFEAKLFKRRCEC